MEGISVIICCFNSARRLPETLRHIAIQRIPDTISWEIIVIDNASTDDTVLVANTELAKYDLAITTRVIREENPGLSHARTRGLFESSYRYLIFCDDDNWLCEEYVHRAYEILQDNPTVAVLGGNGSPVCETAPPEWFSQFANYYATGPQAKASGSVLPERTYVYGAGAIFRKDCLMELYSRDFVSSLEDRKGNKLSAGGDVELCQALHLNGYDIWYDERLKFRHFIPSERLRWEYLEGMHNGYVDSLPLLTAYSYAQYRHKGFWTQWMKEILVRIYLLSRNYITFQNSPSKTTKLQRQYKWNSFLHLCRSVMGIRRRYHKIKESSWYIR